MFLHSRFISKITLISILNDLSHLNLNLKKLSLNVDNSSIKLVKLSSLYLRVFLSNLNESQLASFYLKIKTENYSKSLLRKLKFKFYFKFLDLKRECWFIQIKYPKKVHLYSIVLINKKNMKNYHFFNSYWKFKMLLN